MEGLIAEHISKIYPGSHGVSFTALQDVSIHLQPGSFTCQGDVHTTALLNFG